MRLAAPHLNASSAEKKPFNATLVPNKFKIYPKAKYFSLDSKVISKLLNSSSVRINAWWIVSGVLENFQFEQKKISALLKVWEQLVLEMLFACTLVKGVNGFLATFFLWNTWAHLWSTLQDQTMSCSAFNPLQMAARLTFTAWRVKSYRKLNYPREFKCSTVCTGTTRWALLNQSGGCT